jgi:hypothetical protein
VKRVWIVYTTLPESKTKVVCTVKDNHFALAMPDTEGGYKGVAYFDTDTDAWAWIKELVHLNPRLAKLGPFLVEEWLGYDVAAPEGTKLN